MLLLPLINVVGQVGLGGGIVDRVAARAVALLPGTSMVMQLASLLAIFLGLMAVRAWAIINRDVLLAKLQTGFVELLRIRLVEAMVRADWSGLTRLRHGRVSHILSNDIRSCGLAAHLTLQSMVAAVMLSVQITLALLLSPAVALIVLALLAGGALTLRPALRRSRQLGTQLTDAGFQLTDDTNQFLGGLKLAFSQNLQHGFAQEFRETVAFGSSREVAFARHRSIGQVALTSLAAAVAGVALLLGFGVFKTSPSALIALLVVLARMSGPAAQLQQNLQYIAHSLPAYEQIGKLTRELSEVPGTIGQDARPRPARATSAADVVFSGVSYSHGSDPAGRAGVTDIDLVLRSGELVGITGPSGAGKTTLLDLLVGLLSPASGTITVNGQILDLASAPDWRARLSYVSQDPYLFHDTVAGNLAWAHPGATPEAMWHALEVAGANRLVAAMPDGLATVVGERGTLLSGGERQRIALARALIRNPALLILDEATNAIDVEAERAILCGLASLASRPTVIMVAHREQSLAFCERVITLEAGRIVAERSSPTLSQPLG
ncbi:ABC transporter ATP-binding protein [Sphingomonas sp.]|uniref:ABC transporter ATP-binding protein n=1 Tax=Sphingomonas sp. TaxID=28214 RepID=UPI002D7F16B8|nr:ABC transporter ATP-binding protein [Sphingomonas sp.]HEU0044532.1 ABC transporter ATP-binding protein [Sphingomonas sp.]